MFENVDPDLIRIDEETGEEFATFCVHYKFKGCVFEAEIEASSFDNAGEHLAALVHDILSGEAALLLLTHRSDHNETIH